MGRHSPVGGWELPPASGSSEGVLQLLSDTVAGGQQHKAGAFSIGHGINEPPWDLPIPNPRPILIPGRCFHHMQLCRQPQASA